MNQVALLKSKIQKIQDNCPHSPSDITITYSQKEWLNGDNCGNGWTEVEHYTHYHCAECDKKWTLNGKLTKRSYVIQTAKRMAAKSIVEKKIATNKASKKTTRDTNTKKGSLLKKI